MQKKILLSAPGTWLKREKKPGFIFLLFLITIFCNAQVITVPFNADITQFVNSNSQYNVFLLNAGKYTCSQGVCITRNNIIIKWKNNNTVVEMSEGIQICGNNNIMEGLTWYGSSGNTRSNDPGTLAISGTGNTIRNCRFYSFQSADTASVIIYVGRQKQNTGCFTYTMASNNTIESCIFDGWGKLSSVAGSTESSGCISLGKPFDACDGNCTNGQNCPLAFSGTIIRNNTFKNGPYKQYGYNSVIKVYDPVDNTLIENNVIDRAHEVLEIKANNVTVRKNKITNVSGYNVLANRIGINNLFDANYVENVDPISGLSSQGFMIWKGGNTIYRNNIFHHCKSLGLIMGKQNANDPTMDYVLFVNNTFVDFTDGIRYENSNVAPPGGLPANIHFINNIFYGANGVGNIAPLRNFQSQSLGTISNNIFYNNVSIMGIGSIASDPKFVNSYNADFRLLATSPAIDAGINWTNGVGMPTKDFDLQLRPFDGDADGKKEYDIGAFEFGSLATELKSEYSDFNNNVIIFPNPSNGSFTVGIIGTEDQPKGLSIYDITGKENFFKKFDNGNIKIFSNLEIKQPGVYTITITTDRQVLTKQIMIIK